MQSEVKERQELLLLLSKTQKYFYKFVKNNSTIRAEIGLNQDEKRTCNQATKNWANY